MLLLDPPSLLAYTAFGTLVVFKLPGLGRSVLRFMRDLDDYREKKRQ
jgi:hypothetical protein